MEKVIYIDSVFLLNLVMDLFLLKLTAGTLKKTATFLRILAGSLVGAAGYCLILCLPGISYSLKVLLGMLPIAMGMIKLVCRTKGLKELIYGTGWLFTYSFLLGGFMLFLIRKIPFLNRNRDSVLMLLLAGFCGFSMTASLGKRFRRQKETHFCRVELEGDEGPLCILGLIDTGNGLVDPVSKKPVAILEEEVWEKMERWKRPEKYKLIPFHSIGKEHGILEGYEVENIRMKEELGQKSLESGLIAVFKGKLSKKGEYQMILPSEWNS